MWSILLFDWSWIIRMTLKSYAIHYTRERPNSNDAQVQKIENFIKNGLHFNGDKEYIYILLDVDLNRETI